MTDVLTSLQGDFKLFLQALWDQLDLPLQGHNMPLQTTYNTDQNVYRSKPSEESEKVGLLERSCYGHSSMTQKRR